MSDYEKKTTPPAYITSQWRMKFDDPAQKTTYSWVNTHGLALQVTTGPLGTEVFGPSPNLFSPRPYKSLEHMKLATLRLAQLLIWLAEPNAHEKGLTVVAVAAQLKLD